MNVDNYGRIVLGSAQNSGINAAQLAKELQLLQVANIPRATSNKPVYTPNQYTTGQLAQFNQPQGMQGNPYYQQYLNKMGGMGAGAGKSAPSTPSQGTK